MTTEEAKQRIIHTIMSAEISTYMAMYAPDQAVISISNIIELENGLTKYRARKALKELIGEGMIEYTSQGCPAIVSCGEYEELVCEAGPPINGYCLTQKAFKSDLWKEVYSDWCKSMEDWANEPETEVEHDVERTLF